MKYEEEILKFWKDKKIFEKSISNRENAPYYSFYDGPPFATGTPHYGHILATTIKDSVLRYFTMQGYQTPRRVGWDCHGLPIENLIEKEFNIKNKKEIEELGIEKFNNACRKSVFSCVEDFEKTLERVGRWADYSNSYTTMDNDYIESVWWVLKTLWDKKLVEKSYRVSPYCPRCSTTISNFEVNQGYKEVKNNSIYTKFKLKDENAFLLIWTTTPWTLAGNVAVAVNKDVDYVLVNVAGERYVLAKERLSVLEDEYEIEEEFKGKELLGKEYQAVFNYLKNQKPNNIENAFKVINGDFVSVEDGTGLVHIAPMYGEDDYNLGKENSLPFMHTVDEQGRFFDFVIDFKEQNVKEANKDIVNNLKNRDLIYKEELIEHTYPFCWRCDSPLIYYAKESYYVLVTKIKDQLVDNNQKIHWVPNHIKNGRFGKWLEGARDWDFARNRFWGAPIPIWRCEDCLHEECFASREELESKKIKGEIKDLHKPHIDEIILTCPKCGKEMKRIPEVFDCWFESGSMPYAQWHYPFENKEFVEKTFPANFIAEGLDQTRGWFYTLNVLSTALTLEDIGLGKDKPAFENAIVNGLILDSRGRKLSKKLKNYPDPKDVFEKYGADALRYFLLSSTTMGEDYRFSEIKLKEVWRKIIFGFENCFVFYNTYKKDFEKVNSNNILDKWILSKTNKFIKSITLNMNDYELAKASRLFFDFMEDFSNWYIRRSRKRFQSPNSNKEFLEAQSTLHFVLYQTSKIMAPFIPFITEKIYQEIKLDGDLESVHLCDYPKFDDSLIDDNLEKEMDEVRTLITIALDKRKEEGVKVRQPLAKLFIKRKINNELFDIIKEELNVKEIVIDSSIKEEVELDFNLTEELKQEGIAREIIRNIQQARKNLKYSKNDKILLKLEGDNLNDNLKQFILKEVLAEGYIEQGDFVDTKELNIYNNKILISIQKT